MRLSALLIAGVIQGCVFIPRTTIIYDENCKIHAKQMVLDVAEIGGFGGCVNEGCVAILIAAGAVSLGSAVVSGSIVVAGNIVYWFEKQGKCSK